MMALVVAVPLPAVSAASEAALEAAAFEAVAASVEMQKRSQSVHARPRTTQIG